MHAALSHAPPCVAMRRTVSGGALTRLTLAPVACSNPQAPKKGPKEYDDEDLEFLKKKKVRRKLLPRIQTRADKVLLLPARAALRRHHRMQLTTVCSVLSLALREQHPDIAT